MTDATFLHHACFEPLLQQLEHPAIRNALRHELHQPLVVDAPEVVADVGVEHVISPSGAALAQRFKGHRRAPLRTETTANQKGAAPNQKGSTPNQKGSTANQKGSTANQKGSTANQKGSTANQKGSTAYQ